MKKKFIDCGHLEDGYYEIWDEGDKLTLHIWDWKTPGTQRTKRWQREGEVHEISPAFAEKIKKGYARGKIRVISQIWSYDEE